jgi:hypothetical protein
MQRTVQSHLVPGEVMERLGFTDTHALRVASTKVAFKGSTEIHIKTHGAEGAGAKAHSATDAPIVSDHDPFGLIPEKGLHRTDLETRGIRALETENRKPEPFHFILADHPNAAPGRVVEAGASYGAGCFTFPAPVASKRIEDNGFHLIHQDRLRPLPVE